MTKKGKGLMAHNKEDLVKIINDLQNKINNPKPASKSAEIHHGDDDAVQTTEENLKAFSSNSDSSSTSSPVLESSESILNTILTKVHSLELTVQTLQKENTSLRQELKTLKKHTKDIADDLYEIEKDITRMDQYRIFQRIQNIPEDVAQEQLKPTIVHALDQMNVTVQQNDIEAVHRLKKGKQSKGPASVIVRFRKRDDAFKTLQKKRETKKIVNNTFGPSMKTKIFIHENLGPRAKKIFDFCLKMQKEGAIYKVWTDKGITHFLYENDEHEKPTKVFHYDELWNIFPDDD